VVVVRAASAGTIEVRQEVSFWDLASSSLGSGAKIVSRPGGPEQHLRFARRTGQSQLCRRPAASVRLRARVEPSARYL